MGKDMERCLSRWLITFTGSLAALACYSAPFHPYVHWVGWCLWGFLCGFVLPFGVWLALGKHPASCGLTIGEWRFGMLFVVGGILVMTPLGHWMAPHPDFQAYYAPIANFFRSAPLTFWSALFVYMLGWEFLFRGFLLFGLADGHPSTRRLVTAVAFSTLLFGASHWGKPLPELMGSFLAGLILCAVVWRTKSIWAAVALHTLVFGIFTMQVSKVSP